MARDLLNAHMTSSNTSKWKTAREFENMIRKRQEPDVTTAFQQLPMRRNYLRYDNNLEGNCIHRDYDSHSPDPPPQSYSIARVFPNPSTT